MVQCLESNIWLFHITHFLTEPHIPVFESFAFNPSKDKYSRLKISQRENICCAAGSGNYLASHGTLKTITLEWVWWDKFWEILLTVAMNCFDSSLLFFVPWVAAAFVTLVLCRNWDHSETWPGGLSRWLAWGSNANCEASLGGWKSQWPARGGFKDSLQNLGKERAQCEEGRWRSVLVVDSVTVSMCSPDWQLSYLLRLYIL